MCSPYLDTARNAETKPMLRAGDGMCPRTTPGWHAAHYFLPGTPCDMMQMQTDTTPRTVAAHQTTGSGRHTSIHSASIPSALGRRRLVDHHYTPVRPGPFLHAFSANGTREGTSRRHAAASMRGPPLFLRVATRTCLCKKCSMACCLQAGLCIGTPNSSSWVVTQHATPAAGQL